MRDLATLTAADFEPLLHERFRLDDQFDLELVEVTASDAPGSARAQFSLVFAGGPTPPLPQGIYPVRHEALGVIEIFLVPIAADRYQAVFT